MNKHDDNEIVYVLQRDFPKVYEQILEYLDELQDSMVHWEVRFLPIHNDNFVRDLNLIK